MRIVSFLLGAGLALAFAAPAAAQADKDDKHSHQHNHSQPVGNRASKANAGRPAASDVVSAHDRAAIVAYYRAELAAGRCPPGLARKDKGCAPPGQAGKQWEVGRALPEQDPGEMLPAALLAQLAPQTAFQYRRVGTDILLVSEETRIVVVAVADLSKF